MPVPIDLDVPHLEAAAIVVDSHADEAAWASAPVIDAFVTYYPAPDQAPTGQALVRVLSDEKALYVHWTVVDPEPERVRARMVRRDNIWGDDWVGIYLDPAGQGQKAYLLLCNPLGVQADATRMAGGPDRDAWDGQWSSAGRLTETGYEVEMAIPWRSVRHPAEVDPMGLSLLRMVAREAQRSGWPRRDPDVSGILVQEYLVGGPGALPRSAGVMLIPELSWARSDQGSPDRFGAAGFSPGLTARYDPGPRLATLVTVNPDFSQVEGDAAQLDVNQRFPLSYGERRPFFTEGQEWFEGAYGDLVYTRSMVDPRYGARATAEVGPWTFAALHVMDARPQASVSDGPSWTAEDVEGALAFDTLVRARRDLTKDGYAGLVYSDKTLPGAALSNRVGGVDGRVRLSDTLVASGAVLGSTTTLADGERLSAPAAAVNLSHASRNVSGDLSAAARPAGFRAENGFVTRSDVVTASVSERLTAYPRARWLSQATLTPVDLQLVVTPRGELLDQGAWIGGEALFANSTATSLWLETRTERVEGVPLSVQQAHFSAWGDPTRWLSGSISLSGGTAAFYAEQTVAPWTRTAGELTLRPGRRVLVGGSATRDRLGPAEDPHHAGWIARGRLEVYATRALWARLLVDHSAFRAQDSAQLLLAWQRAPGKAVWLGGSAGLQEEAVSWQVFGKVSWVFLL
ncbi:MAG: carbohydrate binding family 9 domain-containing protein [Alphaproteobacteria bacterium]|nr:carbohydrate binding family 9 domain-containing protein [Alphaproteobacteria bacterium]